MIECLQDQKFSTDKNGALMAPVCWSCGDKALSLCPGVSLTVLAAAWKGEPAAVAAEPDFTLQMKNAIKNHKYMTDEGAAAMDLFTPNGRVSERHVYGVRVYQTYACVTESEYQQLVEYTPTDIKTKKAFTLPVQGPLQNMQLWLVDLRELDPAVAQALRKVDIEYTTQAELEQVFLHPEQQLEKKQPWKVFGHRVKKHFDKRPDPLRPAAQRPQNVQQLVEAHLLEKSKRAQQVSAAAAMGIVPATDADGEARDAPVRRMGLEEDDEDEQDKPSKRRRAAAKKAAALTAAASSIPARTIHEMPLSAHAADLLGSVRGASPVKSLGGSYTSGKSKSKTGKAGAAAEEKEGAFSHDLDMKEVADAHLSTSTGSSVKSLVTLTEPRNFLVSTDDMSKVQSNALNAAGSSDPRVAAS